MLIAAQQRGLGATLRTFVKLSGPGWLQSAITLGGGSLAGSLYLGVLGGYTLLWLQPFAMILGIIMLSAIAYVTLSTGERPFQAINRHVNPVLGWSWAIASLAASMVWCMPQYALAVEVLQQNLLPSAFGADGAMSDTASKVVLTIAILVFTTIITWAYDSGGWGIRLYEAMLKLMVAAIVLCFAGVIVKLSVSSETFSWGDVLAGFLPSWSSIAEPAPGFADYLAAIPSEYRAFWKTYIVDIQRDRMITAAATAVGINMTFLFPYTLLARKWSREFRGLAAFDLSTGMFVPYVLATSFVVIAAAHQFHPGSGNVAVSPSTSIQSPELKQDYADEIVKKRAAYLGRLERQETHGPPLDPAEVRLAALLTDRSAMSLAGSLESLTGPFFAQVVFGLGVLGMTLSTITILMLISGFVVCEMLGLPEGGWIHRIATLAAATGAAGPFLSKGAAVYVTVPTSIFGMMLLPIAYFSFLMLMNQRSLLGAEMPRGGRRAVFNLLMFGAAGVASLASFYVIWTKAGVFGLAAAGALVGLAVVVHFNRRP